MSKEPLRVLLVDDHPVVRRGLIELITCEIPSQCFEAADRETCLSIVETIPFDIAVLDISLGQESGLDLVPKLDDSGIRIVVYSMFEDAETIRRAIDDGCMAYISKRDSAETLLKGLREALAARVFLSPIAKAAIESRTLPSGRVEEGLSRRELQTLDMLGRGCSKQEIAAELAISVRTAETYFQRINQKMNLKGLPELRKFAIEWRLSAFRTSWVPTAPGVVANEDESNEPQHAD